MTLDLGLGSKISVKLFPNTLDHIDLGHRIKKLSAPKFYTIYKLTKELGMFLLCTAQCLLFTCPFYSLFVGEIILAVKDLSNTKLCLKYCSLLKAIGLLKNSMNTDVYTADALSLIHI